MAQAPLPRQPPVVEITAAELRERLARGQIGPAEVQLAALLGDPVALNMCPAAPPEEPTDLKTWVERIQAHATARPEKELHVRMAIAGAERDAVWTAQQADYVRGRPDAVARIRRTLHAIEDWALCPCDDHVERIAPALAEIHQDPFTESARFAALAVTCGTTWAPKWGTARAYARRAIVAAGAGLPRLVLPAVRAEVVPWVLGLGDPVRDRVLAR